MSTKFRFYYNVIICSYKSILFSKAVLVIYLCEIDLDRIGDLSDSNIVFAFVGCSVLGENIKS